MELFQSFQILACLIAHAPLETAFFNSKAVEEDEVQGSDKVPGWDEWLHDNSVVAYMAADTTGRIRARAFGVSNPYENFRSLVGASFRFRFIVDPTEIPLPGEQYRFTADVETDGLFLHVAAKPRPDDNRQPLAQTISQMDTRLRVFALRANGTTLQISDGGTAQDHLREVDADSALTEVIGNTIRVSVEFSPSESLPMIFRLDRTVLAAACGVYSDIRIRGSEDRLNFRVRVRNPHIRRVLDESDYCFGVLNP